MFQQIKASQLTNRPVPPFKPGGTGKKIKQVEWVEVRRRGKGDAFGVNVPQEPLMRAKLKPGARLKVTVRGRTISLTS